MNYGGAPPQTVGLWLNVDICMYYMKHISIEVRYESSSPIQQLPDGDTVRLIGGPKGGNQPSVRSILHRGRSISSRDRRRCLLVFVLRDCT